MSALFSSSAFAASCKNIGGVYGDSAAIIAFSNNKISVIIANGKRPNGHGTCIGNKLKVRFQDDPKCCSGTFDGQTVKWSNGSFWKKNGTNWNTGGAKPAASAFNYSGCKGPVNHRDKVVNVYLSLNKCKIVRLSDIRQNSVYLYNNRNNVHAYNNHRNYESHWEYRPNGGSSLQTLPSICKGAGCGNRTNKFCYYKKGECNYTSTFTDKRGKKVTLRHKIPKGRREATNIQIIVKWSGIWWTSVDDVNMVFE